MLIESDFIYKGFQCVVITNPLGFRCGYVKVPKDYHHYKQIIENFENLNVHGGITYNGEYPPFGDETEDMRGYWLGFDAMHGGDATDLNLVERKNVFQDDGSVKHKYLTSIRSGVIRDNLYMAQECMNLVNEIQEVYK